MTNGTFYQTGDLQYLPLGFPHAEKPTATEIPAGAKRIEGTQIHATPGGNSHGFRGSAGIFEYEGVTYIDAVEDIVLTHPEHKDLKLLAGKYEVRHVREKDHFNDLVRAVVD